MHWCVGCTGRLGSAREMAQNHDMHKVYSGLE